MILIRTSFANAFKNIFRNKVVNFLSLGIIAFTMLIFGIFHYLSYNLDVFISKFSRDIEAIFYFRENAGQQDIKTLMDTIRENILVREIKFRSKEQAQVLFLEQFPELNYIVSEFQGSPFPASIEVRFRSGYSYYPQISSFINELERMFIVESKQVNVEWIKKIQSFKDFINVIGIFLSTILIFISIFIIFNVIKLNIFYRKDEVVILRMVGAQDWFIRFPFIIEGALLGLLGSLAACVLLAVTLRFLPVHANFVLDLVKGMIDFKHIPMLIFVRLVLLGTLIGMLSSYFSIRKFLNE